jgi:hypothetical protein
VRVARIGSDVGAGVVEGAEAGSSGLALVPGFGLRADFEGLEGSRRVYFVVIRVCEGSEGLCDWEEGLLEVRCRKEDIRWRVWPGGGEWIA